MEYISRNSCDIAERDHPKESETEKSKWKNKEIIDLMNK